MSRAFFIFSALLVVFAVLVFNSIGDLPDNVAIHFDANSAPDRWVSRGEYDILVFLFLIGLPLILFALMAGLPRLTRGKGLIPNNEYWFADERRRQTESFLLQHSSWLQRELPALDDHSGRSIFLR
jgi:RsiW-degrading membrane proteinase PrsW (M82 family)